MHGMRRVWFFRFAVLIAAGIAALGFVVMTLWNWLLPELFSGVHPIGYGQALGLLLLSRILVGAWRGHGHGRWHKHRHWESLTAQERASLQAGRHGCCGRQDPPPAGDASSGGAVPVA